MHENQTEARLTTLPNAVGGKDEPPVTFRLAAPSHHRCQMARAAHEPRPDTSQPGHQKRPRPRSAHFQPSPSYPAEHGTGPGGPVPTLTLCRIGLPAHADPSAAPLP